MAREIIGIGLAPNDGTGDVPRVAGNKINSNFEELYDAKGDIEAALPTKANRDGTNLTAPATWREALGVPDNATVLPRRMTAAYVSANKTLVETPAALFAGGSPLASRRWLIIRNESTSIRARIGRLQSNLQRDGEIIEPGAVMFMQLDPATGIAIYGCSEGAAITVNIGEDVG